VAPRERAYLRHTIPGRIRVKIPARRGDRHYFANIAKKLGESESIRQVKVNHATASVLIEFAGELTEIVEYAAEGDLFDLSAALLHEAAMPPIAERIAEEVTRAGRGLERLSGGGIDLESAALVALLGMSTIQLIRGNIPAPAASLLWYAGSLLLTRHMRQQGLAK
jgi:hypothetical protein